jgi:hypothetical protein
VKESKTSGVGRFSLGGFAGLRAPGRPTPGVVDPNRKWFRAGGLRFLSSIQRWTVVRPMLPDWPNLDSSVLEAIAGDVTEFVQKSIGLAPAHVRAAVALISLAIWTWVSLHSAVTGRSVERRRKAISIFHRLPGPGRSVLRLYRSLVVLAFYEHPVVRQAMNIEDPGQRQDRFRALRRSAHVPSGSG